MTATPSNDVHTADEHPTDEHTTTSEQRFNLATFAFRGAELLGAATLAIAQPLLSLLGANPVFFVAHGITGWELLTYALVLILVVPVVLLAVITAVMFAMPRIGEFLHYGLVGTLVALALGPPVARAIGLGSRLWLLLLVLITVGAALLLYRAAPARSFLRILSISPVTFLAFFLFHSPTAELFGGVDNEEIPIVSTLDTAPVVWLLLDQFPVSYFVDADRQIVSERYPNLARLAEMSTWYPNATAGTVKTDRSVPAALSGTWPEWDQLPVASQQPINAFTLLGSDDYPVHAEEYVTQMCPDALCRSSIDETDSTWADTRAVWVRYALPSGVADRLVPQIDDRWDGFGDQADGDATSVGLVDGEATTPEEVLEIRRLADDNSVRFRRFLEPLTEPNLNGLHYAHLFLPHEPLRYLPDGRTMALPWSVTVDEDGRWPDSEPAMRTRLQRAMTQTMFADRLVGELLDTLEAAGTLDDVVLVVMSDHGASTRPAMMNRSDEEPGSAVDTVPLPLFIKAPGQSTAEVNERRVQQVDILPTVLDILNVDLDVDADGVKIVSDGVAASVGFDGLIARGNAHNDSWAQRVAQRMTPEGLVAFQTPPLAWESPTVAWIANTFPDPANPYQMHPFVDYFDQPVPTTWEPADTGAITLTVDNIAAFGDVDTTTGELPASVTGIINGTTDPIAIAVIVNNEVAGITESFMLRGQHRISVVIDPVTLIDGSNEVMFVGQPMSALDGVMLDSWQRVEKSQ